jgi:hypothetical protein
LAPEVFPLSKRRIFARQDGNFAAKDNDGFFMAQPEAAASG